MSPYRVYNSMDNLDWKIRRFLVDEGYLFPQTDAEIERSLNKFDKMQTEAKAQLMKTAKIEMNYRENPGGQHVTINSTAVKVSSDHIGFSVVVDIHRSQLKNWEFAMILFEFAVDEYLKGR